MARKQKTTDTQAKSMAERAYLSLRRKIASGELAAGAALSETALSREIGVSRTPLREAIRQLAAEGFLRQTPNRGSVVAEFSKRDISELYEVREALEVYAVGRATEHGLRDEDVVTLRSFVDAILGLREELAKAGAERLSPEQMQRFLQADLNFHAVLVRAAANRRLLKAFADTRVLLAVFAIRRRFHDVHQLAQIHQSHADILEAVIGGDATAAMKALSEHIRLSKQERLEDYDDWENEVARADSLPTLTDVGLN